MLIVYITSTKTHMSRVVGWSIVNQLGLITQMRNAIGLVVGWFVINQFRRKETKLIE